MKKIAIKEISASQLPKLAEIFNKLDCKWSCHLNFTLDTSAYSHYGKNTVYFLYPEEKLLAYQNQDYLNGLISAVDEEIIDIYTAEQFISKYSKDIAIKCTNIKYLIELGKILNDLGYVWAGGDYEFLACAHYSNYKENTVYFLDTTNKTIFYQDQIYLNKYLDKYNVYEIKEFISKYSKDMEKKTFTKQDLHSGMVIECQNHNKYLLLKTGNTICGVRKEGMLCIDSSYDNSLICTLSGFSINKIYTLKEGEPFDNLLNSDNLSLIWERQKEIELTLDEIARKFNVDVNLIKIKK